jgi:hypothetical protein
MRVMPWEGSGRYSPGPGMVKLLEKWFYQELRPLMAICSLNPPGNLATVSISFMHAHGDRYREVGDSPADVTRKTSVSQQARSIVISLIIEN